MRSIREKSETRRDGSRGGSVRDIFLLSIFLLNGCGGELAAPIPAAHGMDELPRRGGVLRLASFADIRGLDPASISDGLSAIVIELLYAGLVDYDESGKIVPDLAERWDVDQEGLTYRFVLRHDARFHDGEEVTAEDVKRSVERALHPTTPNPASSFYENLLGYKEYTEKKSPHLAGVVVEGKYVVSFKVKQPDATFLPVLGMQALRPVCKSAGTRYADGWHPCGAGPFKLPQSGWDRGRSVSVVRHEGYFRPGLPHLDGVSWTYGMNIVTERFKFLDGELDSIREFSQPDLIKFQNDPRWRPFGQYEPDRTIYAQGMNVEMPPFDNVEVRRAVAAAIDREKYHLVRPSTVRAAHQLLPPSVPGYRAEFRGQRYDRAEALEHMRRAGYAYDPATGKGGYPHVVPYYAYKQGLTEFTGQLLQQDLAKIGIRIELRILSWPTFLALTHRRGKVAIAETGWNMDFPDPSDFFEPLFASKSIRDEDSSNTSFYRNPRLDGLLDRARRELDPVTRGVLYEEANAIVCDEAPWAFTHSNRWYDVWQPYVRGFREHPVWSQYVAGVWLDRESARRAAGARASFHDAIGSIFDSRGGH